MSDWNITIIEEFRANGGKVGGQFEGAPLILIHHIGARSGTERVTPVGCFPQSDGRFAIVASNGGAPASPDWYYNPESPPGTAYRSSNRTQESVAELPELAPGGYAFARLPGAAAAPRAVSWAARPSRRAWRPNSKLSSGAPA